MRCVYLPKGKRRPPGINDNRYAGLMYKCPESSRVVIKEDSVISRLASLKEIQPCTAKRKGTSLDMVGSTDSNMRHPFAVSSYTYIT